MCKEIPSLTLVLLLFIMTLSAFASRCSSFGLSRAFAIASARHCRTSARSFLFHPPNPTARFLTGGGNNESPPRKSTQHKSNPKKKKKKNSNNEAVLSPAELEEVGMEEDTRQWVDRVVVGMNLCPFAARPVADHQLYVVVIRGDDVDRILRNIAAQALVLTEERLPGTALMVCPELFPDDFDHYLTVHNMVVEGLLEDLDLVGKVQVVPFHPQFVFASNEEDEDEDDGIDDKLEYWTNRSPHPMFHILKEDDVSRAVQIVNGQTDRVWQRNIHLLRQLEPETDDQKSRLRDYFRSGHDGPQDDLKTLVQRVLAETARDFPHLEGTISEEHTQPTKDGSTKPEKDPKTAS